MKRVLGYAMLAAPFVGLFAFTAITMSLTAAILVFVLTAALVLWIGLAADMMS